MPSVGTDYYNSSDLTDLSEFGNTYGRINGAGRLSKGHGKCLRRKNTETCLRGLNDFPKLQSQRRALVCTVRFTYLLCPLGSTLAIGIFSTSNTSARYCTRLVSEQHELWVCHVML